MLSEDIATANSLAAKLDALIGDFPHEEIAEWVATAEALLPKMRAALAFYEAVNAPYLNGNGNGHCPSGESLTIPLMPLAAKAPDAMRMRPARLTKAAQVATVMATIPAAEWDLNAIKDGMVTRGWMEDSEGAMHSLQNTLSKMKKLRLIERLRIGVYRLNPEGLSLAQR